MKAIELVGKLAIRTNPVSYGRNDFTSEEVKDYSYTTEPLKILKVTDNHILYEYSEDGFIYKVVGNETPHILDKRWLDDNWTDYEELMKIDSRKNVNK